MENITDAELAALYFQILEGCQDWKRIYKIAIGAERYEKLTTASQNVTASKWKLSERIQNAHAELLRKFEYQRTQIEQKTINKLRGAETEPTETEKPQKMSDEINFLDPEQFLQHANEQANRIKDDKERRSWLEMIAKLMNYKDQADGEATEIKRFYIMKTCENCEIYQACKSCEFAKCPKVL